MVKDINIMTMVKKIKYHIKYIAGVRSFTINNNLSSMVL